LSPMMARTTTQPRAEGADGGAAGEGGGTPRAVVDPAIRGNKVERPTERMTLMSLVRRRRWAAKEDGGGAASRSGAGCERDRRGEGGELAVSADMLAE
jgi:hypothetical protein